ncbi:hypothetical protein [Nocardiopsis valliformis]|uniref:hypothetical protein n=1 Tax=Nocardiopsis valliformis TaxID=239974 RepID=UPI00034685B9|nr:hypothetical protein [Nocardiopsis valliformis]
MSHPRTLTRALPLAATALAATLALTACSGNRADIDAACDSIHSQMPAVDLAAAGIDQDVLVDDIPYNDEHRAVLEDHRDDVRLLEEAARGLLREDAAERFDAVDAVIWELDHGDEVGLADALDREADTQDLILVACD